MAILPAIYTNFPGLNLDLDNETTVKDTDNRRAPLIPNTRNSSTNKLNSPVMNESYQRNLALIQAMRQIHAHVVTAVTNFIDCATDNLQDNETEVLADLIIAERFTGSQVTAYDKEGFNSFLKLLTFFAIADNNKEPNPQMAAKVAQWYSDSQSVLNDLKVNASVRKNLLDLLVKRTTQPVDSKDRNSREFFGYLKSHLKNLRGEIQPKLNVFYKEHSKTRSYLGRLLTYYNSASENAYRDIVNGMGMLNDSDLTGEVDPIAKHDTDDVKKEAAKFVQKHGGTGYLLTDKQEAKLKEKNPEAWKEYRKHALKIRDSVRAEIKKLVRASGKDKLQAIIIDDEIRKLKLPTDFIPEGFNGFYDENSNMYTKQGEQLSANIHGGRYEVNKEYDPDKHGKQYVATFHNPWAIVPQKVYTMKHVQGKRPDKKADLVAENTANLPAIRDAWRQQMHNGGKNHPDTHLAHIIEALYQTSSRIGSGEGMTDGKRTYGMRTIKVSHVKVSPDGNITIKFPGKKGVIQTYKLKPQNEHQKKLIDFIKSKLVNKSKNDSVWTSPNGSNSEPISNHYITKYIQGLGWQSGTHKLRHMRGTQIAAQYLKQHPLPKKVMTQKEVNDYVAKLGITVGKTLGHQRTMADGTTESVGNTALKAYIDPMIIKGIYIEKKAPIPTWLEKISISQSDE